MRYMVIERFKHGAAPVYERAAARGRMLPPGLDYVASWIDESLQQCFQLMETEDPSLFRGWIEQWDDLVEFEIFAVISSDEAAARMARG